MASLALLSACALPSGGLGSGPDSKAGPRIAAGEAQTGQIGPAFLGALSAAQREALVLRLGAERGVAQSGPSDRTPAELAVAGELDGQADFASATASTATASTATASTATASTATASTATASTNTALTGGVVLAGGSDPRPEAPVADEAHLELGAASSSAAEAASAVAGLEGSGPLPKKPLLAWDGTRGWSSLGSEPSSAASAAGVGVPANAQAANDQAVADQPRPQSDSVGAPRALLCSRVLTCDSQDRIFEPGLILARGGRIEYVGPPKPISAEYDLREIDGWAAPGMVDLHSHVVSQGFGDINDMVLPVNTDLSTRPVIVPSNEQMRLACAAGVTTLFLIPGSGTSSGGFGVLFKTKTRSGFESAAIAAPGGLKIAQTHNPERRSGDLGATRSGLYWQLARMNRAALAEREHGRDTSRPARLELEHLQKVLAKELPVLIHTAASDGVSHTVRMWRSEFPTNSVLSHGCFDGWAMAAYVAKMGMPVNQGPRTFDYFSTRSGQIVDIAKRYEDVGIPDFSLNTDAPVIPAEELFLQATVSSRFGANSSGMLRALTIHPARAFGLGQRLGSLEVGKDADLAVHSHNPIDPRSHVELVWIDGQVQYDRSQDGQWF